MWTTGKLDREFTCPAREEHMGKKQLANTKTEKPFTMVNAPF
jgi:hypothetical protein